MNVGHVTKVDGCHAGRFKLTYLPLTGLGIAVTHDDIAERRLIGQGIGTCYQILEALFRYSAARNPLVALLDT